MQRQEDPVKSVRGLAYAGYLRNVEEFGASLDAGQRYDRVEADDDSDIERDATLDADVSKIIRQLDCSLDTALEAYRQMNIAIVTEELRCSDALAEGLLLKHSWGIP